MGDGRDVLEREMERMHPRPIGLDDLVRRRERKTRNQRISSGAVGIAILAAIVWFVATGGRLDPTRSPATPGPTVTVRGMSVDFVIDLSTGAMTPLPDAIRRSLGETADGRSAASAYAVSPDGSQLAYVGTGDDGNPQIFVAHIDGTRVRQLTHDPTRADWPAWSPDGTKIAYTGHDGALTKSLFVLDAATGETTKITEGDRTVWGPTFTPDGSSLMYGSGTNQVPTTRIVPVAGGKSTLFLGPGDGLNDAGGGALSPDGSLMTFVASGWPDSFPSGGHCGPCRFVANADGTQMRIIAGFEANPAGTWSPDGSRIVDVGGGNRILVVDIASGDATRVAKGRAAIWLDDHTLLVES